MAVSFPQAVGPEGQVVHVAAFTETTWSALQQSYRVGELAMPCCGAPAIPKTSANGRRFFAHAGGECGTSPEGLWHLAAKRLVAGLGRDRGWDVREEAAGGDGVDCWKADVLLEHEGVRVVVELQHSYLHLREFLRRQERYQRAGVRCVWMLPGDGYLRLTKAMGKARVATAFAGRAPKEGFFPCLPELPAVALEFEPEVCIVGAALFRASPAEVLDAAMSGRFIWEAGAWMIEGVPLPRPQTTAQRAAADDHQGSGDFLGPP